MNSETSELSNAAARLLDREPVAEYVAQWTGHIAQKKEAIHPGAISVVIFRIDEEYFGVATELVQEVVQECTIRTLPHHQREVVSGLAAVRGELLICVSLRGLLGIEDANAGGRAKSALLILNRRGGRFAFSVDEICGIYRYDAEQMRAAPATLAKTTRVSYTKAILPWKGRSAGYLDEHILAGALDGIPNEQNES